MKTLLLVALLAAPSFSGEYEILSHQYDLTFQSFLATKIKKMHGGSVIRVYFKHQPARVYRLIGYYGGDDSLWVEPINTRHYGLWKLFERQVFGVQELQDVVSVPSV